MKKVIILAGVLAACTFSSCKKDKSDPDSGTGAELFLKKVTEKNGNETTVHTLTYDGNKKLASVIGSDNIEKVFFTYDAAGNLTKVEEHNEEFHNIYTYTYTNNIPVSGTFKSWHKEPNAQEELVENDALTYTVENNLVTKLHLVMTMQNNNAVDFNFTYNNGDLTKVQSADGLIYTATFTYGTKKSAFPPVTKWILDQAGFSLQFGSKHEIKSIVYDYPGTDLDMTINNTYTYNSNGYPATSSDGESDFTYEYQ